MLVSIYTLKDPRDGTIHYVGQTQNLPLARLAQHVHSLARAAHRPRITHKEAWITELAFLGLLPEIEIVDYVDKSLANEREKAWIDDLRAQGEPLCNKPDKPPVSWRQKRRGVAASVKKVVGKRQFVENSQTWNVYQWLVRNDPGWTEEDVPSVRRIIKLMENSYSTQSVTRGRVAFICDFKS